MRFRRPVVMCDAEDGECGEWEVDDYEGGVSSVTTFGPDSTTTIITATVRAPGWISTETADYCPEHKAEAQS
ncbi:hypothetical protein ACIRON_03015 [Nocardioides sp. NPDC101246]|uniref:hypothetical protein n=1 Tax=Nocardioides sp. NPDC101246 TaxID=3364336 RepID=UPI003817B065